MSAPLFITETEAKINTTLKTKEVASFFSGQMLLRNPPCVRHPDPPKNWDNIKAVNWIMNRHPSKESRIMDAGGLKISSLLPTFRNFGYKNLFAMDLNNPQPSTWHNGILYEKGDITETRYPDNHFDAVGCMSVVEHGVPLEGFFAEMSRIIKPGGSLVVSTDYWKEKIINHTGVYAFGVPVFIFSKEDVEEAIVIASRHGFRTESEIDYECSEKTISWCGFQYTFIIICFVLE